jgi:type VI secretion system secreted protein Hcp
MALFDAFLKIDGIDGESVDNNHSKWIELYSFSWGVAQAGDGAGGGGGGAGKVNVQDFSFTKKTDSASPLLFQKCCAGKHFAKVELACRKAGDTAGTPQQADFMTFDFFDVILSSYNEGGNTATDQQPIESISFNFQKIEMSVASPPDATGVSKPVTGGWDLKKNQAI